jgi:hypothetical protein
MKCEHSNRGYVCLEPTYLVRIRELEAALQGIVKLGPLTLIGGDDMSGLREAYSVGAHRAFGQAAEMAASALETEVKP